MGECELPMKALTGTVELRENQLSIVKSHYDSVCLEMIQPGMYATMSFIAKGYLSYKDGSRGSYVSSDISRSNSCAPSPHL